MPKETKRILIQVGLFIATFFTTTLAGTEWAYGKSLIIFNKNMNMILNSAYTMADFQKGLAFSIPLLLILTVHEFGHYFTALYHKVKVSLPYYIPVPPIPYLSFSIGTMGAVIRLRSRPETNVKNFDIGLAGPLSGFIVALVIMFYAFQTLPPADYVFQFHPEYEKLGANYAERAYDPEYTSDKGPIIDIEIGTNLMFWIFQQTVGDPSRVPNPHELMHYPTLLACYIALFFTCLNLLPIGQLDGGHVVYGLFGYKTHRRIATIAFIALIFYAGLGLPYISPELPLEWLAAGVAGYLLFLYLAFSGLKLSKTHHILAVLTMFGIQFLLIIFFPNLEGYPGWLLFGLLVGKFVGIDYPRVEVEQPLDSKRILLGWITLLVFILCFSPAPLSINILNAP
jgi:membrane-associated protease RseP (regulator of RpoE activity)